MKPSIKLELVLYNIRSTYNVGAILRTAEGLGVEKVIFSGYTPRYGDRRLLPHLRQKLDRQIAKSALGAEKIVACEAVDDLVAWLSKAQSNGDTILGLENNLKPDEQQRRIILGEHENWLKSLTKASASKGAESKKSTATKIILVLGEEVAGIPQPFREKCDYFLEIPMVGQKESFNVSIATAIACFELLK